MGLDGKHGCLGLREACYCVIGFPSSPVLALCPTDLPRTRAAGIPRLRCIRHAACGWGARAHRWTCILHVSLLTGTPHYPVALHIQNTRAKLKSGRISRQQSMKLEWALLRAALCPRSLPCFRASGPRSDRVRDQPLTP